MKALWDKFVLWLASVAFALFVGIVLGFMMRRKMSHNNGVAGRGRITVVADQTFPPHPFFEPGRVFPARVRHASAGFLDDAMMLVRSMSVKFADSDGPSPLDLELNTGRSLFWTARNFLTFVRDRKNVYGMCYKKWYQDHEQGRRAALDSIAYRPGSYHQLEYTSQTPTWWIGSDGVERLACYRIVPHGEHGGKPVAVEPLKRVPYADEGDWIGSQRLHDADGVQYRNDRYYEQGMESDKKTPVPKEPQAAAAEAADLDRNYLKKEWMERIQEGPIQYMIQVQTRLASDRTVVMNNKVDAGDPKVDDICDSNVPWGDEHEWHDLAVVTIEEVMAWDPEQYMYFSIGHAPEGLGILPALSIDDPNSLNYMRVVADLAKHMRLFATRVFGPPPRIQDEGVRNVDEFHDDTDLYNGSRESARVEEQALDKEMTKSGTWP